MRRWALLLLVIGLAGIVGIYAFGSYATRPEAVVIPPLGVNEVRVTLHTDDGIRIAGSYFPAALPKAPGVLLLHGVKSSRAQFSEQANWLHEAGYAVLAIDFRGHGESQQVGRSFGFFEANDAHAAFSWLKDRQGQAPVAVIGFSLGGAAALLAPKGPVPADALILQAVYPDIRTAIRSRIAARLGELPGALAEPLLSEQSRFRFGVSPDAINPAKALHDYDGSVMMIGGENDLYTPPFQVRTMAKQARHLDSIWIMPHETHGSMATATIPKYRDRVLVFLRKSLHKQTPVALAKDLSHN